MCAQKSFVATPGPERAIEELLNIYGGTHFVLPKEEKYKGINIMLAEAGTEKEKKKYAVLAKTFKEHDNPTSPSDDEVAKLIRFANEKKMTPLIAQLELGTNGTIKKVQKIPLLKASLN